MYASASEWQFRGEEIWIPYHGRQKEREWSQEYGQDTLIRERPVPNSQCRDVALRCRVSRRRLSDTISLSVRGVLLQTTRVVVLLRFLALHRGRAIERRLRDIMHHDQDVPP